jgi:hypothetical protein
MISRGRRIRAIVNVIFTVGIVWGVFWFFVGLQGVFVLGRTMALPPFLR